MTSTTDQDRKKKSLPLRTHGTPSASSAQFTGEVINGVIIEDEDPQGPGGSRSRSDGRPQSEPLHNEGPAAESSTGQPAGESVRAPYPASRIRHDVDEAGRRYMEQVRRADLMAKKTPKARKSQLTGLHKAYTSMMVLSCLQPLSEGINAKSVLSVVGMSSALCLLSPNFRNQVGDFGSQMSEAIEGKIEERKKRHVDRVVFVGDRAGQRGVPLSERWEKKYAKAQNAERGGRDAYTARSAGMTEVALTENAYAAMRVPGADVDGIRDTHDSMLKDLYQDAYEDGVEASEVAESARVVVGLRLEEEPGLAEVFGETAHGQFTKSDPREVVIAATGETTTVWTGEFENRLGQKIDAGSMGLRSPMDADQHQSAMAETMTADMVSLTQKQGVEGLNVGVVSYASAWGLKGRPDFSEMADSDSPLGERLRSSRTMQNSMGADGITAAEQQRIYSNAYVDSMENISRMYPEVEREWAHKFGENWRDNMRDFVRDPESFMSQPGGESAASAEDQGNWEATPDADYSQGRHRQEPQGKHAGPSAETSQPANPAASTARKYRNARINQNYIETADTGVTGLGSDDSDHRDQDFQMGG
jgi:hypothetical protein